jgi:tetratricopeptide (TPR) repeat protein
MRAFLGGTTEMQLELDGGTAGIPWELLDTSAGQRGTGDARPWALRAKLLRKLRTSAFRSGVVDANADASVLIIGEPACAPDRYARLRGARAEARIVAERLGAEAALGATRVKALISPEDPTHQGPDAHTVINTLLERDWRVVHIAGHGEPGADGGPGGVVLSNGTFLGPREIKNMEVVPELVFVNCCHLAAIDSARLLKSDAPAAANNRPQFAASVAEALIGIGVRCVVAAGWAVDDDAAYVFAGAFYGALLRGARYIDAIAEAREAAWKLGGNTWAAYQCYGDPDWTLRPGTGDAQRPATPLTDEFAGVASAPALKLALETLAVRSRFQKAPAEGQRARIRYLEARFVTTWGAMGDVAEAFGDAWSAAGDAEAAMRWYEKALAANDGTASFRAHEQLVNLRVRSSASAVDPVRNRRDDLVHLIEQLGTDAGHGEARAALERELGSVTGELAEAASSARAPIMQCIAMLESLIALQPTMERESLCGSAYKRLAMIEAAVGSAKDEKRAIQQMKEHYSRAEALGTAAGSSAASYPAMNSLVADLVLHAGTKSWKGPEGATLERVRQALAASAADDPDFWSIVGLVELRMYEAVAAGRLVAERAAFERDFSDLHGCVTAVWMWKSVHDAASFVLRPYAQRASAGEKAAVNAMLTQLQGYSVPDRAVTAG